MFQLNHHGDFSVFAVCRWNANVLFSNGWGAIGVFQRCEGARTRVPGQAKGALQAGHQGQGESGAEEGVWLVGKIGGGARLVGFQLEGYGELKGTVLGSS